MRAVTLHLLAGGGDLELASPSRSPGERVVLWHGLPPGPAPEDPRIAPVVIEGDLDGRHVYAEQVPPGVPMAAHPPPAALRPWIVSEVLAGVAALHGVGQVHGSVGPARVILGADGRVVLCGRGRQGGKRGLDLLAATGLIPASRENTLLEADASSLAAEFRAACAPDDQERLAAWVRETLGEPEILEPLVITLDPSDAGVDEIVPDLGPERVEGRGLLDRWSFTTTGGVTAEVTEERSDTQPALAISLWERLAEPLPEPSDSRFEAVEGQPSRAIATLLAEDPPDLLSVPTDGRIPTFVLSVPRYEDQPTAVGASLDGDVEVTARVSRRRPRGVPIWLQWGIAMAVGGLLVWVVLYLVG